MNLHAILCWWDESPTWLAATVASLATIGVDHVIAVDGRTVHEEPEQEYPMLYRRFAEIVRAGKSDADIAPLQHVADAFMLGKRNAVEAFFD